MYIRIKPPNKIKKRLGLDPGGRVQTFFTSTCAKHMDKYVPFDEGNLADYYIEDNDKIIYHQPYATYQYRGIREDGTHKINPANRDRSKHPLATSYWDKKMKSAEMTDIVKEVQDYIGGK